MPKVFLSFRDEDLERVKKIIPYISSKDFALDFYDGVFGNQDEEATKAIKIKIGEKIVGSDTTVCLISENTYKSQRVDVELKKSLQKGNKIIAMALEKVEWAILPEVIKMENLRFYPWDPKKLNNLILEGGMR
jgi:hypothetical protein